MVLFKKILNSYKLALFDKILNSCKMVLFDKILNFYKMLYYLTKFYHVEYFDIIMAALLIVFAFYTEVDFLCLSSRLFLVLLMSALIQHLKFSHGIEATQCLLNYKCHIFHPTLFWKAPAKFCQRK